MSSLLNLHLQSLQRQEVAAEDDRVDGRVDGVHVATRNEKGAALIDDYLEINSQLIEFAIITSSLDNAHPNSSMIDILHGFMTKSFLFGNAVTN